jgi:hypothetical protein
MPSTASAFFADSARFTTPTAFAGVIPDSATTSASADIATAARARKTVE